MADHDETVALPPTPPPTPPPSSASAPAGGFAPGLLLAGRYRIVSLLGKGGMGEVYRADDLTLGQSVALKFLPAGAATDRFRNEVKIARQVSHPNVCRVYDVGEIEGRWFLSMEYVDGEDLGSLLRRIGRLPTDKALEISRKLCAGLAAAHEKGVLHRDLKPGNVMLDGRGQVLLTDFGLAAAAGEVEGAEILSGTPAYMAPEQLSGREVTARSDIYSLGLVIYEIFTGKRPYESDTLAGLQKARSQSAPASMVALVRDVDPMVERVILRCLDPDPSKRPSSAIAVSASLPGGDPLAAALAAGETPSPQMIAAAGEGRGLKAKFAIPLLAALVLGILGNAWLTSHDSVLEIMQPENSPDVLRVKAREMLARLGYTARSADAEQGVDWNHDYVRWLEAHEKNVKWREVLLQRPSAFTFWVRESPYPMTGLMFHNDLLTPGAVRWDDPAVEMSGMIAAETDSAGRLLTLTAVPPQRTAPPTQPVPANWDALFEAAGLDRGAFQEVAPEWTALVASDERKAWTGVWPGTKRPLRVEAAMFQGKPVSFQTIGEWTKPDRMPTPGSDENRTRFIALLTIVSLVAGGSAFLSRRNMRKGKGDREGATKLAWIVYMMLMSVWACQVHLVWSMGLVATFFVAAATAAGWSMALFMTYIALEPFVRRSWPQAIISWSSITVGNWRDPIVGRDILAGLALGISWRLIDRVLDWVSPSGPPNMVHDAILESFRSTFGTLIVQGYYGIRSTLVFFLILFMIRMVIRRQLIASAVFVVGFSLLAALNNDHFWVSWAVNGVIYVLIAVAVTRLGLLALAAAVFMADGSLMMSGIVGSGWYVWNSVFVIAVFVALGYWACRTAMAGDTLLNPDAIE